MVFPLYRFETKASDALTERMAVLGQAKLASSVVSLWQPIHRTSLDLPWETRKC